MVCMCGDKECEFAELLRNSANFIFTPSQAKPSPEVRQREIIHVLLSGVRSINIDLSATSSSKEELKKLVDTIDGTVKIFLNQTKFNLRITKICTIRGRQPIAGRMRNNKEWNLQKCKEIVLTCDQRYGKCSSDKACYVSNLKSAIDQVKAGDFIHIGRSIKMKVTKVALKSFVTCLVVNEGKLKSHQQVELPVAENASPKPTDEEIEDCEFAIKNQFDVVIVPSVKRPEHFHTIKGMLKGRGIKLIAQIHTNERPTIDKIIKHFYGVFITKSIDCASKDYIVDKARKSRKLVVAEFSFDELTMDAADSIQLKPLNCAKSVSKSIDIYTKAFIEKCKSAKSPQNVMEKSASRKLIFSLTSTRYPVEEMVCGRPGCPIVVLTKCPSIAKLLQLWRNVHAMVYVDNDNKAWVDQRNEMIQIVASYGRDHKMFEAEVFSVNWFR